MVHDRLDPVKVQFDDERAVLTPGYCWSRRSPSVGAGGAGRRVRAPGQARRALSAGPQGSAARVSSQGRACAHDPRPPPLTMPTELN
jgi:hypothetical protein